MKPLRTLILIFLVFMMLASAGCTRAYSFDFTKEKDFYREDGIWSFHDNLCELSNNGLFMFNSWVAAPHIYTGDLKATVRFKLEANSSNYVPQFSVLFSSDGSWYSSWGYAGIRFDNVGHPAASYTIFQGNIFDGPFTIMTNVSPIPGMIINGLNSLTIEVTGGSFAFWLNGNLVAANIIASYYKADSYCLSIHSIQDISKRLLYFTDVRIEYDGARTLR